MTQEELDRRASAIIGRYANQLHKDKEKEGNMNLSELKKEIANHGKRIDAEIARLKGEIERLEKGQKPLTFGDLLPGDAFRFANDYRCRRMKVSEGCVYQYDDGPLGLAQNMIYSSEAPVVLQDCDGNDRPREEQVRR